MKCHICGSEFHSKDFYNRDEQEKSSSDNGGNIGNSTNSADSGSNFTTVVDWKYVHPADQDFEITVNNTKYFFYKHCVCKFTGKQRFYNRTHGTSKYRFHCKKSDDYGDISTRPTDTSIASGTSAISSLSSGSADPGCLFGVVYNMPPVDNKTKFASIP